MNNRKYIIFNISEVDKINFSEVLETSKNTLRKSVDGNKSIIKWENNSIPISINNLLTKEGPYNHEQIMTILSSNEWVDNEI
jgi:hypothetical protein